MVFDNNEEAFLIECKRPNNKQSIRNRKQLDSYIATTRIGIGIYFGEFIEVFYDERSDKDFALPVLRIEYNPENNLNGEKFGGFCIIPWIKMLNYTSISTKLS